MRSNTVYHLKTGVQVRPEVFGLLFYNYRGPRLYFVPSKDLIPSEFFGGKETVGDLVTGICKRMPWPGDVVGKKIQEILDMLEGRELIYGESVC